MSLLIAPIEALTDSSLTDPERRVLLALFSFRGKDTNTVWPSIESIAKRANINDETRVSKLTASLSEKGWLTKKKRGFTGCNQYMLSVPSRLDLFANLDSDTKLDCNTLSNLDGDTKSNLDSDAKYKEQTIEQTIEHKECAPVLDNKGKAKTRKKAETTIVEHLANCKEAGCSAIPSDHSVFEYADSVGIPEEFLYLGWKVFRDMMRASGKRQKDWPATFKNYVARGWLNIWGIDVNGQYYLNTAGKQAQMQYRSKQ